MNRLAWKIRWRLQPIRCSFGRHHMFDVIEDDGSVVRGFCFRCDREVKPERPQPPNAVEAHWLAEMQDELRQHLATEEDDDV